MANVVENTGNTQKRKDILVVSRRYTKAHILQHWVNLLLMLIFFTTGIEVLLKKYPIGDYKFTQQVHLISGYIIVFWTLIGYMAIMIKNKKLHEVFPTPKNVLDMILIVGCAVGILDEEKYYPHYDKYIPEKKKYIQKYHPVQTFLGFFNIIFLFFIAITGFVLANNIGLVEDSSLFVIISKAILTPVINMDLNIRFIHFLAFTYFLMTTILHGYFSLLKDNRERFKAMVSGFEVIGKMPQEVEPEV